MADANSNPLNQEQDQGTDELALLKDRARLMGIDFSNNIGIDTLRARIAAKLADEEMPEDDEADQASGSSVNPLEPAVDPKLTFAQQIHAKQLALVRIRVTCMDPKKADLPGEIFTVANEYIGTVRKYVPFGEATEEGYHVPYCIFRMMEERRFLNIRTVVDRRTKARSVQSSYAKEFALEVLPPLTEKELAQLATAQAAAGSVDTSEANEVLG